MTLDEAIRHAREKAQTLCGKDALCAKEHEQIADWLTELKTLREQTAPSPKEA